MSEIILSLFKEHKVLSIEDLKEKLNIESAKDFVELIKYVEKLEQKSTIVQLPNVSLCKRTFRGRRNN